MKAIIITSVAGFIKGFLETDIRILQSMGYQVHCAANIKNVTNDASLDKFLIKMNIEQFYHIDFNSKNPLSLDNLKASIKLFKLFKRERYNLIHCHTPIAGFVTRIAAFFFKKNKTKVFYTSHGFYFHKNSNKKTWILFYSIEKALSLLCDAIITINQEDFESAKKMYCKNVYHINGMGVDFNRLNVKIDREAYRASLGVGPNDIMLLAAGELTVRKNHQILLKALSKINDPRIILILCGRALNGRGTQDQLERMAQDKNIRFKMLGFRNDMPMIYHCADIGALPSTREGLGMMGLQSLAVGVPLVTSNVHGIVDYMIEGKTGYMANPDDASGFANGIIKLLNPDVRRNMREDCIQMARKFSNEISVKQREDIYKSMIEA